MAKKKTRKPRLKTRAKRQLRKRTPRARAGKAGVIIRKRRKPKISASRLERALRVLFHTNEITEAARAIRVSPERLKDAAKQKSAIVFRNGRWKLAARLPRQMPIFSGGRQISISVRSKSASQIGRYMSAVGKFLTTNDPAPLATFQGLKVKDAAGILHPFETRPNTLYRLSSAGGEPFEEVYRIVI